LDAFLSKKNELALLVIEVHPGTANHIPWYSFCQDRRSRALSIVSRLVGSTAGARTSRRLGQDITPARPVPGEPAQSLRELSRVWHSRRAVLTPARPLCPAHSLPLLFSFPRFFTLSLLLVLVALKCLVPRGTTEEVIYRR